MKNSRNGSHDGRTRKQIIFDRSSIRQPMDLVTKKQNSR